MPNNFHQPKKILETEQFIVFDDFLPPEHVERVYDKFIGSAYEYINTGSKASRAWRIRDGFPLRGQNLFYQVTKPDAAKPDWVYPSNTALDLFVDAVNNINPEVAHMVGAAGKDWQRFAVTEWVYQMGTGLSLHDDGAGTYSGAFTYFLNKEWNIHWGGLLLVVDKNTDAEIDEFKKVHGAHKFWKEKWLAEEAEAKLISNIGLGQFIFPKFNRIVFIKNNANHMVTTVTASAGDRTRKSLAGFFHIKTDSTGY